MKEVKKEKNKKKQGIIVAIIIFMLIIVIIINMINNIGVVTKGKKAIISEVKSESNLDNQVVNQDFQNYNLLNLNNNNEIQYNDVNKENNLYSNYKTQVSNTSKESKQNVEVSNKNDSQKIDEEIKENRTEDKQEEIIKDKEEENENIEKDTNEDIQEPEIDKEEEDNLVKKEKYIVGKIITENLETQYIATITVYKNIQGKEKEQIAKIETQIDGVFKIPISKTEDEIEEKYDVHIEKEGYLDYIIEGIQSANIEETIQIGVCELIAGDVIQSKDINILDLSVVVDSVGKNITDENRKYDLNEDGKIDKLDVDIVKKNYGKISQKIEWAFIRENKE